MRSESILKPSHSANMREFRPMPSMPKAMKHIEKDEAVFSGKKILKPSHSANMREFRPMPTTPKAMRHFEKNEERLLRSESNSQTVSLSQKTENHHPALVTLDASKADRPTRGAP